MNNHVEDVILPEDPRSAVLRTDIQVWAAGGKFYTDEEVARRQGATHVACKTCGSIFRKAYPNEITCGPCVSAGRKRAWERLPIDEEYDGGMCFNYDGDESFDSEEDVLEWCLDHEVLPSDLMLVGVKPAYLRQINEDFLFSDDYSEDFDLAKLYPEIVARLDELNTLIGYKKCPVWFVPSGRRIVLETPPDWEQAIEDRDISDVQEVENHG